MRLLELIRNLPEAEVQGNPDVEVRGICYHSGRVQPGELFAAVPGTRRDGHEFLEAARERGAAAVLVARHPGRALPIPAVIVPNVRLAMGQLAERLQGRPSHRLQLLGITGTNGKTTLTYLLEEIARQAGARPGVIGTINNRWAGNTRPAGQTTPESVDLVQLLAEMARAEVTHVLVEVSSHALDQQRVAGLHFRAGVFTNLTQDHLDYHREMEAYFGAKRRLFTEVLPGAWELDRPPHPAPGPAIINLDDPYGRRLAQELAQPLLPVLSFGVKSKDAQFQAREIAADVKGIRFRLHGPGGEGPVSSPLLGRHNVMNLLAAAAASFALGFPLEAVRSGAAHLARVPGRLEPVPNDRGFTVLVDFAHTPDAVAHAIAAGRELGAGRLISLLGCGGDRDRTKRPVMGRIASQGSDQVVVTSDNPRTEDPDRIIREIEAGIERKNYAVVPDRRAAIAKALELARPGDLVLLMGKGHEDYQIVGETKSHFNDGEVAAEMLGRARGKV
jgi:UDP-N-acetylmuramoyl-L-alanyl-D-glutamate--2,6-diaminopimelate ligase